MYKKALGLLVFLFYQVLKKVKDIQDGVTRLIDLAVQVNSVSC